MRGVHRYMVVYDLNNELQNFKAVHEALNTLGEAQNVKLSVWVLATALSTPRAVLEAINAFQYESGRPVFSNDDDIIVVGVHSADWQVTTAYHHNTLRSWTP